MQQQVKPVNWNLCRPNYRVEFIIQVDSQKELGKLISFQSGLTT